MDKSASEAGVWTATGHERPIFLDEHGRRRRWVLLGGVLSGSASALWLGALVAGAIGFSSLPAIGVQSRMIASRAATSPTATPAPVRFPSFVHRRHAGASRHSSTLDRATELAVSRGLLSER